MKNLLLLIFTIISCQIYAQKIEDLPRATTSTGTDLIIVDQSDSTRAIAKSNFYAGDTLDLNTVMVDTIFITNEDAYIMRKNDSVFFVIKNDTIFILRGGSTEQLDIHQDIIIKTGKTFTLGDTQWSVSDSINGEVISDRTIDDDALDFTDITGADLTLTDCGAITGTTITASSKILVGDGTLALPSISFINDLNTGFYWPQSGFLYFSSNGVLKVSFGTVFQTYTDLYSGNANRWIIKEVAPSSTVPVFIPNRGDQNTGIGHAGNDSLSVIAGGVEGIRVAEGDGNIKVTITDTLEFDNGAQIHNEETDTLFLKETAVKVTGDLKVDGHVDYTNYGGFTYISTPGTQTIGTGGTFERLNEGDIAYTSDHLYNFTHSDGRLTYTGTPTIHVTITVLLSAESGETAQVTNFRIAKNGTTIAATNMPITFVATDHAANVTLKWLDEIDTNDYFEIFGTSDTNGDEFDILNGVFTIIEH